MGGKKIRREKKSFSGITSTENERRQLPKAGQQEVSDDQKEYEDLLEELQPEEDSREE